MLEILFRSKNSVGYSEFDNVSVELRKLAELVKAWWLGGRSLREIKKDLERFYENLDEEIKIKKEFDQIIIELNDERAIITKTDKNKNFRHYNKEFKQFVNEAGRFEVEISIMHKKLFNALKRKINLNFEEKTKDNKKVWTAKATVNKEELEKIYKVFRSFIKSQDCFWDSSIYYRVFRAGDDNLYLTIDYYDVYISYLKATKLAN
jgi:hypothetical protein